MGGAIGVTSEPGRGSTFYFEVPLPLAEAPCAADFASEIRRIRSLLPTQRVRALVADDFEENREMLRHLLTDLGCQVRVAENGRSAVDLIQAEKPDVAFLDIRMPDLGGKDVARRVRGDPGTAAVKLVAVSASVLAHEQQDYLESGFEAFLPKPFRLEEICDCLRALLRVEFEYEPESSLPSPSGPVMDPRQVTIPGDLLGQLLEAARRHSATQLERGLVELERRGEREGQVAREIQRLGVQGDFEAAYEFLAKVADAQKE
jgi:CheY-like chemotaxis protein